MSDDVRALAERERESLADLLRSLDDAQWSAPSLCADWTVREVALHAISYDQLSWPGLVAAFVRGGLRVDAINELVLRRLDDLSEDDVVDLADRSRTPRGLTAALGGMIALTDGTIHQQDIRRALGLPRTIGADQLITVLDFALKAPTLPARGHAKGLRLVATDVEWSHGSGEDVSGTGEALLMAVAGRPDALADLGGPGVGVLARRVRQR